MSEPVAFRGSLHHWTLGEPPRLELICVPTDNAIAQTISLLKGRALALTIFFKDERICTLPAALPPISTVVGKCGKATKVKLDVYPTDMHAFLGAIRSAERDIPMRFEFAPGETLPAKEKREPKPPKEPTPYGAFWRELDKMGFHNRHDVRGWLGAHDLMEAQAKERLREVFRAKSRATDISPQTLREWLARMPGSDSAITMIEKIVRSL